jgi:uncharacterized protein (DUF1697 family)
MTVMVALLRGINVGGSGKLAMSDLRRIAAGCGFGDVQTYVQSGNVVFSTSLRSPAAAAERLGAAVADGAGITAAVVVRTRAELRQVVEANPYAHLSPGPTQLHVVFLPGGERAELPAIDLERFAPESAAAVGQQLYLHLPDGIGRSKLATALNRSVGHGTARNWRTVTTLLDLAEAI